MADDTRLLSFLPAEESRGGVRPIKVSVVLQPTESQGSDLDPGHASVRWNFRIRLELHLKRGKW